MKAVMNDPVYKDRFSVDIVYLKKSPESRGRKDSNKGHDRKEKPL